MRQPSKAKIAGALLCAMAACGGVRASSPGVPSLGNTAGGYVAYAETDLPPWFRTAMLQAADNTPIDNQLDDDVAELGRVLFYDKRLSHNDGTACASCHTQETGFSDPNQFSEGFEGGLTGRHSPGLSNARYYARGRFFWDERAATLEDQTLGPIQDAVEMGSNLTDLEAELQQTEFYPVLFQRAFGDSTVTSDRMSKAMAQFVRAMVSYQSEFDQAIDAGTLQDPDFSAVQSVVDRGEVQLAEDGHSLFQMDCASCHGTSARISDRPHNIGLDAVDADDGAGDGEFKSASLRNIAERGRYMHDGRFSTLEEVVEFYSTGVQNNPNLSNRIPVGGFGYTQNQVDALVAYLETFSDPTFLTSSLFSDPFVALDGDYNGDGVVDTDDLAVWQAAYAEGEPAFGAFYADGNGDGVVDTLDFLVWRENLGAAWDDGLNLGVAVPEPSSLALAAAWLVFAGGRRRCSPAFAGIVSMPRCARRRNGAGEPTPAKSNA